MLGFGKKKSKNFNISQFQKYYQQVTNDVDVYVDQQTREFKAKLNNSWGLVNPSLGIGSPSDIFTTNAYANPNFSNWQQLDAFYRTNTFARKLINIPATDVTRKWRKFKVDDPKIEEARKKAEINLKVKSIFKESIRYADLYGGSALLIVIDGDDDSKPLDMNRVKRGSLKKIQPVFLNEFVPSGNINWDPSSYNFRRSETYTLVNNRNYTVHHSRLIFFDGVPLPLWSSINQLGFGDSVLTAPKKILDAAEIIYVEIAKLLTKANIDVVKMDGFSSAVASSQSEILERFNVQKFIMSNSNTLLLDKNDDFDRKPLSNLAGLTDILLIYLQMIASAANMPLTRFLGTSVGGFSTGDNEITEYYDSIAEKQQSLIDQVSIIDHLIEQNTFGRKLDIEYEWIPLHQVSETQKVDNNLKRAQTDQIYLNSGVVSEKIVAQQLKSDGLYNSLDDEFIEDLDDGVSTQADREAYAAWLGTVNKPDVDDDKEKQTEKRRARKEKGNARDKNAKES